jgi:hypothetical protein
MKIKNIYIFIILLIISLFTIYLINKYIIENYKSFKNVGYFPLKFNKIVRPKNSLNFDSDNDYSRHHYKKYKRRYNFLAQRNAGLRH